MNRIGLSVACVLLLLCFTPSAATVDKQTTVHFIAGPQGFTQPKVKLQIDGTKLVLTGKAGKKKQSYTIPLQTVTFMAHSPVRFNRASQVSKTVPNADLPRMGSCSGLGCAGNVLVLFLWGAYETGRGAAVGVAATQHGKQHFITIDWQDDGVEYELQLEAAKEDYAALMKKIEDASGKRFFDFEARWKQVEAEIDHEKSHADVVLLKKFVRMGELSLVPGVYSVVTIPRQDSFGEVYLFEGKRVDSTTLRGVGAVTIAKAKVAALKEPEIDYTESAPTQIKEIRTVTKTVTFITIAPPAPSPEKGAAPQEPSTPQK